MDRLLAIFGQHILGLNVLFPGDSPGKPEQRMYTGILVDYEGLPLWLTAGHVIRRLNEIRQTYDAPTIKAGWFDDHEQPDASAIPIALSEVVLVELDSYGLDIGLACISPYSHRLIRANSARKFLDPHAWLGAETTSASCFLVGFPEQYGRIKGVEQQGRQIRVSVDTGLTFLQVEEIPRNMDADAGEFWSDEEAFYGRLVNFESKSKDITSIVGMSGGPIFSVTQEQPGIRYRPVAVQSAWLPSKAFVRAVRMQKAEVVMRAVYEYICAEVAAGGTV